MFHSAGLLLSHFPQKIYRISALHQTWIGIHFEESYLAELMETFIAFSVPFDLSVAVMVIYLEVLRDRRVLGDSSVFLCDVGPHDLSHLPVRKPSGVFSTDFSDVVEIW